MTLPDGEKGSTGASRRYNFVEVISRAGDREPQVFIVEDDPGVSDAISNLLESVDILSRQFPSCESFLEWWSMQPGCLLLDAQLPGTSGVEFQEHLCALGNRIPIIFMTAFADVPMVRKVMKAGAVEFLTKPVAMDELLNAIRDALALDGERRTRDGARKSLQARFELLTERERAVMGMVTQGLLNKQVAAELNLSEITVKLHRRQVMDKMQAKSLADLAKMAAELG